MSLARFHLPPDRWSNDAACLEGEEAKHCAQVMRRGVGDEIIIFDGVGNQARGVITASTGRQVELKLIEWHQTPPPAVSVSLIQAIPKGSNMELIIEKAVELGISRIHPVFTERTVVRLDSKDAAKKQQKWQRIALEACKQCGQDWLPTVHTPSSFAEACRREKQEGLKLIAAIQPEARPLKAILAEARASALRSRQATLCIGPEGDFTPTEYALAREHGFMAMTLGPIILRVETATLFSLSILQHELRETPHEYS